jgi:hypothetical protein
MAHQGPGGRATEPDLAWARTGAFFYILWAGLHLIAALMILEPASQGVEPGATLGRVRQNSAFMAIVSLGAIWIALRFNWRNHSFGFWFNLYLISATDLAFVFLVLVPGWEPLPQGLIGPTLWVLGAAASSIGHLRIRPSRRSYQEIER